MFTARRAQFFLSVPITSSSTSNPAPAFSASLDRPRNYTRDVPVDPAVSESRLVQRVGSAKAHPIDVRVVAATHRSLKTMVREGQFREDLYYRLAMVDIALPSLAKRREDLPLLQRFFIEKFSADYGRSIAGLTRRAQTRMTAYPWPGNIRELENVIGNACMMVDGPLIDVDDLPENLRAPLSDDASTDETFLTLDELQNRHILRVLQAVGGSKPRAAEILGIGRATFTRSCRG